MKVWVLIIDSEVFGVFKNAEDALEEAKIRLYDHACLYNYSHTDYQEALDTLIRFFNERNTYGFFGTALLDWDISVTESELS